MRGIFKRLHGASTRLACTKTNRVGVVWPSYTWSHRGGSEFRPRYNWIPNTWILNTPSSISRWSKMKLRRHTVCSVKSVFEWQHAEDQLNLKSSQRTADWIHQKLIMQVCIEELTGLLQVHVEIMLSLFCQWLRSSLPPDYLFILSHHDGSIGRESDV